VASQAEQLARDASTKTVLLDQDLKLLREEVHRLELGQLRERVAVLESHLADLKKAKDEADKRQWQFVYIFAGAMASLLVTVVVQLVLSLVKK